MPEIGPDLWKMALSFYWFREYGDGRVEMEFDLETGQIRPWGPKTPEGLIRAGWLPVSQDLAQKMKAYGEFGIPTQSPSIMVSPKPGDELEIFKDCSVLEGSRVSCKLCGSSFRAFGKLDSCPQCGAREGWRCPECGNITDTAVCPDCKKMGRPINPLESTPEKWEEVVYILGIKGIFRNRLNSRGLITEH